MGLSRTVSEIDSDFSRKLQKFPTLVFCAPPVEWVPLGIGYRSWGSENQNDGATGPTKKFDDIFSRLDRIHERDRQTDGRTDTTAKTALTHSVARQKSASAAVASTAGFGLAPIRLKPARLKNFYGGLLRRLRGLLTELPNWRSDESVEQCCKYGFQGKYCAPHPAPSP